MHTPLGALIKTTLVDFPGRVACTLFLTGCNLRCPYCYNGALVCNTENPEHLATFDDVVAHLDKRRKVLSGFVISGGEALLHPALPDLIRAAKEKGYAIKLDTNGTLPDKLAALINEPSTRPDFIAMDIKTSPARYAELLPHTADSSTASEYTARLSKSISIISKNYAPENREWRTVLVPPLVQKEDIDAIAALLPADASWQFAQFRNENCLNPAYNDILPYTDAEAAALIAHAKTRISGAVLR